MNKKSTMDKRMIWVGVLCAAMALFAPAERAEAQVRFETGSTDSVRRMAQNQNKLVFIDLYATWCGPCRAMERTVFAKKEVGEFMERRFVAAKYDVDRTVGRELMSEYGRGAIPLYLIFDTDGVLWGRIEGATSEKEFLENLRTVLERYDKEHSSKKR